MSLPILSRRFFTENPPSADFFASWKAHYAWSDKIIPLYQWEGILYVGCLAEPKTHPITELKTVYVLCDSESLASTWEIYTAFAKPKASLPSSIPASAKKEASKKAPDFPLGIEEKVQEPAKVDDNDFFAAIEKTTIAKGVEVKPESGFDQIAKEFNIDLSQPSEESVVASESSEEDSEKTSATSHTETEHEPTSPIEGLNLSDIYVAKPSLSAVTPPGSSPAPAVQEAPVALTPAEPKKAELASKETIIDHSEHTKTSLTSSMPDVNAKRSTPVSTEVLYKKPGALSSNKQLAEASMVSIRVQNPDQAENFINEQFKELSYHYSKSMILMVNKDNVTPWKWNENFQSKSEKQTSYPLNIPSPFRIVNKTQKSFHGYVVANDINEKFFEEWNQSHIPEHLTVSPIVVDDEVIGMVLGIGSKDADNKNSLQLSEKVAAHLSKQMQKQPDFFKAA